MIQRLFVFLLITVFLLQVMGKSVLVFEFSAKQAYISQNLCINKNKPSKHCNGRCYLKKQLDKQEKGSPLSGNEKAGTDWQLIHEHPLTGMVPAGKSSALVIHYLIQFSDFIQPAVFHPPLA